MQIVINIPNDVYEYIENPELAVLCEDDICLILLAIHYGIVLPKGHGDLKDMNELINILKGFEVLFSNDELRCSLLDAISDVPTIIEKDGD